VRSSGHFSALGQVEKSAPNMRSNAVGLAFLVEIFSGKISGDILKCYALCGSRYIIVPWNVSSCQ